MSLVANDAILRQSFTRPVATECSVLLDDTAQGFNLAKLLPKTAIRRPPPAPPPPS